MTLVEQNGQPNPIELALSKRDHSALLQKVNSHYSKAKQSRIIYERQWYVNLAFYFGRHYVQWAGATSLDGALSDSSFSRLHEPAAPPWRVRLVTNKSRAIIRGEHSKVNKEKPRGFVIPSSTDDADRIAASAAENIFDACWRGLYMNRCLRRATFWSLLCGTSFIKDWYDKTKIDFANVKGAIQAEPVSPFNVLIPDTQEEELENQAYVIHVLAKSADWVRDNFNIIVKPDSYSGGLLESSFLMSAGIASTNMPKDYVAVRECHYKPCREWPKGAVVTWVKDQILNITEDWPFEHGDYPFTKLEHIPTGRFYGDSTLVDIIPLQREFNRTRSQLIEAKNRMAKPQLSAPRGSVDVNKITSEPGLVVEYKPGFQPPAPIPLQNIPGYVIQEYDRIQKDMDDISSQHEVTRGSVPPGVTAATAISYLQEQDDSKLAPTVSSLEEGVERLGKHFLSHVKQFWNAQRKINVIGENGAFEAYMFSKANIRGNTDFRVEAGSATPVSRAAKQAFIMELVNKQIIPPDKALRYLNMGETAKLYEEMQLDARQAQRENVKLSKKIKVGGQWPFGPNEFDNHQIHTVEHDNYCKTQEFEELDDEIKVAIRQHANAHKQGVMSASGNPMLANDPRLASAAADNGQPVAQDAGEVADPGTPTPNMGGGEGAPPI
jgi:hypothetical protein